MRMIKFCNCYVNPDTILYLGYSDSPETEHPKSPWELSLYVEYGETWVESFQTQAAMQTRLEQFLHKLENINVVTSS